MVLFFSVTLLYSCKNKEKDLMDASEDIDSINNTSEIEDDMEYPDNELAEFITYIENKGDYEDVATEPNPYESTRKFAAAVNERSRMINKTPENLDKIEAMEVQTDSVAGEDLKAELKNIVSAMEEMQETAYSEMNEEVDELRKDLESLYKDEISQSELNAFFIKAAAVLKEMDNPADRTMEVNPGSVDYSKDVDTIEVP